jgi:transaldolase
MTTNDQFLPTPLKRLSAAGVSVWLDDLSRELMSGGQLQDLIDDHHVVGITSNPTIFASALSKGELYEKQLRTLAAERVSVDEAVFTITTDDVRQACLLLRPLYDSTSGQDGRVSLEVQPRHARDAAATITEARTLWQTVDQPNAMIKIPATVEGLEAITATIAAGISVNVTLIFSVERYNDVLDAYITGLEQARSNGLNLDDIRSVASFFISRIDAAVDSRLEDIGGPRAIELQGTAAVANAHRAYAAYENVIASKRWQDLAAAGAHPQRPLWASTGVKSPTLSDTHYVEQLVAPGTVNTMPGTTLRAFEDHGQPRSDTLTDSLPNALLTLEELRKVGINLPAIADALENEGLQKFEDSWADLGNTVTAELNQAL